ncbi:DUF58 domain-containing protein [Chitinibacter sp. SCUT-21]|uniref:DUF58 domain-containing protein n=1 Tax=Chitinibacter sp. SCUT-21 TaxID=2970891 RepID=UPI0035A6FD2C
MMSLPLAIQARYQRWIAERHPPESGRLRVRHQRLYIVPSLYGFGFALIALTMLVGALNYQVSLGFFFAFLLIGIAHAILLRTYANLLGVHISCGSAVSVFAGENIYFPLTLHNDKKQSRFGLTLSSELSPNAVMCDIAGLDHVIVQLPVITRQRGRLKIPRLTLKSTAPIGFFRCWTYLQFDYQALVYPQPESDPPPFPEQGLLSDGKKMTHSGNDDFVGLREFQRGDALHDIAWKQSARTEQILIRQHQSPIGATLWLNFDEISHLGTEAKLSRLCAWILQAEAANRPYGLALPTQKIAPNVGGDHLHRCLRALAEHP